MTTVDPAGAAGADRIQRGPIDRRLLELAPSLRAHLLRSGLLAVLLAVVVVAQAEVIAARLPRLVAGDAAAAAGLAAALAAVGLARWVVRDLTERSAAAAVSGTRRSISDAVLDHVAALDEAGAAAATPSRVTSLLTSGMDALDPWIRTYLPALCVAAVVPAVAWTRILVADPLSAMVLALAVPLIPVFMVLIGKYTQDRTDRQWAALQRLSSHFHDVLTGLVTLRLFGRADAQVDGVRANAERYRIAVMRTLRVAFLSALALELLASLSVALVAVEVGIRLAGGSMVLGTGLLVLLLAPEVSLPLRRVGAAYHAGLTGLDAAAEVTELLSLPTTPDGPVSELVERDVVLRSVVVRDPDRGDRAGPVDLEVRPGELVALVGPSGSGKSTVLEVLRGRVPTEEGRASIGGVPVALLSRATREQAVVHVAQTPSPLGDDVHASVGLGAPGADAATVDELLGRVGLGGRGHEDPAALSGGELRRVTIARAALRVRSGGAWLVLADEPTSHLDPELRGTVAAQLAELAHLGAAVVVATHDPSVIAVADRVTELDHAGVPDPTVLAEPAAALPVGRQRLAATGLALPGAAEPSALGHADRVPTLLDEMRWLRQVGGRAQGRVVAARVLGVLADACSVGLAATAAWLIVRAAEQPSFADLAVAAVGVRAFGLGKGILRYAERLAAHDATFRLLGAVRGAVVARLARVVPAGLPHLTRGDLMSRVVDDVDRLADLELRVVAPAVSAVTVGLVATLVMGLFVPSAGVVLLVMVVVGAVLLPGAGATTTGGLASQRARRTSELAGATMELGEHLDELVGGGAVQRRRVAIGRTLDRLAVLDRSSGRRLGRLEGAAGALGAMGAAATVFALGAVTDAPTGPMVGVAVLVPLAVAELLVPLVQSGSLRATAGASTSRIRSVLAATDPVSEPVDAAPLPASSDLWVDSLHARWPGADRDVLRGVDLELCAGSLASVTGPSGSGKSTFAAVLVRFVEPTAGRYHLGGVPTETLGGDQVREVVTWVPQQAWLADTSLRENLRLAQPGAGDDELWHALDRVVLGDWARAMPDGLDTMLGPGGVAASGGQRQRIALARVLLADRGVVVFDEPTAQLDQVTAGVVLAQMLDALVGRSVVVLGHERPDILRASGAVHLELVGGQVTSALTGAGSA